jgi:hypothetical protein
MQQPPHMSHAEKQARAQAKRQVLLKFLASGEVYTVPSITAQLMAVSQSSAERTLSVLVLDGSLKFETHIIASRKTHIYGITSHGLALMDEFDKPFFQLGKTNSSYIPHHLQTQRARLAAEAAGWTEWVPGKMLHGKGLLKVPDAIATSPSGKRVALEIENHIKSPKRTEEVVSAHLQSVTRKLWDEIHYLTPADMSARVEKAFLHVQSVPVKGERVPLDPRHRAAFKFFDLQNWPNERSS